MGREEVAVGGTKRLPSPQPQFSPPSIAALFLVLDATATQSHTYLGHAYSRSSAPKARFFFTRWQGHGDMWFYDLLWNGMIRGLGKRRLCMSMVRGMASHLA